MVAISKELDEMNKHFRRHHNVIGSEVTWFEYDTVNSTKDDVYDEGPERVYLRGRVIPTLTFVQQEDTERDTPEGRKTVQVSHFVLSARTMAGTGISSPAESPGHLNDIFFYSGRYFSVTDYQIEGLASDDVMISVQGTEIFVDEEMANDLFPPA